MPPYSTDATIETPLPDSPVAARPFTHPSWLMSAKERTASRLTTAQIATLVLWVGCAVVGLLGFAMPYTRPHVAAPAPEAVTVEKLTVDLTNEPLPPADVQPLDPLSPPPPPSAVAEPAVAQPIAVADPSTVAFALPVEGPTVVVPTSQAAHGGTSLAQASASAGLPAAQTLVFGQGEGRQPAPEYPARAMKLGQEGVVGVRLTVNEDGHVTAATVAAASPYPMLDDAAERCVRHRWRFSRGSLRVFDVSIRFALAK